jgi:hypothetical protein
MNVPIQPARTSARSPESPQQRHERKSAGAGLSYLNPSWCDDQPVPYYMRFLCEDDHPLDPDEILSGLRNADPLFRLDGGILARGDDLLAELEVSWRTEQLFAAEIDELREQAREQSAAGQAVLARLESVTAILAVRVLWQERTAEQTLTQLDPMWRWLLSRHRGLIQADGEGFYDGQRLILAIE